MAATSSSSCVPKNIANGRGHGRDEPGLPVDELECPVCLEVPREPRECAKCLKFFCRECVARFEFCPCCKDSPFRFRENPAVVRLFDRVRKRCEYCDEPFPRGDLEVHQHHCDLRPRRCGVPGCLYVAANAEEALAHLGGCHRIDFWKSYERVLAPPPACTRCPVVNFARDEMRERIAVLSIERDGLLGRNRMLTARNAELFQTVNNLQQQHNRDLDRQIMNFRQLREELLRQRSGASASAAAASASASASRARSRSRSPVPEPSRARDLGESGPTSFQSPLRRPTDFQRGRRSPSPDPSLVVRMGSPAPALARAIRGRPFFGGRAIGNGSGRFDQSLERARSLARTAPGTGTGLQQQHRHSPSPSPPARGRVGFPPLPTNARPGEPPAVRRRRSSSDDSNSSRRQGDSEAEISHRINVRLRDMIQREKEALLLHPSDEPSLDSHRLSLINRRLNSLEEQDRALVAQIRNARRVTNDPNASASAPAPRAPSPPSRSRTPSPVVALRRLFGDAEPVPLRPDPNASASASTPAPAPRPAPARAANRVRRVARRRNARPADIERDSELEARWDADFSPNGSHEFKPDIEPEVPEPVDEVVISHQNQDEDTKPSIAAEAEPVEVKPNNEEYTNALLTPYDPEYANEFKPNIGDGEAESEDEHPDAVAGASRVGVRNVDDEDGDRDREPHSPSPFDEARLFWDEEEAGSRPQHQPESPGFEPPDSSRSGLRGSPTPMLEEHSRNHNDPFSASPTFSWNDGFAGAREQQNTASTSRFSPFSSQRHSQNAVNTALVDARSAPPPPSPFNHSATESLPHSPASPNHEMASPEYSDTSAAYSPHVPPFDTADRDDTDASPVATASPIYSPTSPNFSSASQSYIPTSPEFSETSDVAYSPHCPPYDPTDGNGADSSPTSPLSSHSPRDDEPTSPLSVRSHATWERSPSPDIGEREGQPDSTPPESSRRSIANSRSPPTAASFRPYFNRTRRSVLSPTLPAAFSDDRRARSSSRSSAATLTPHIRSHSSDGSP